MNPEGDGLQLNTSRSVCAGDEELVKRWRDPESHTEAVWRGHYVCASGQLQTTAHFHIHGTWIQILDKDFIRGERGSVTACT